jgi:hypothetical protein
MRPNALGRTQLGLSMIGFLFVAIVVVVVAMIGFRVTPAYIEYFAVQRAMEETLSQMRDISSAQEFRRAIDGRLNVNYVEAVKPSDFEFKKQGNVITVTASWERRLHIAGNAFILLEFEAVATR